MSTAVNKDEAAPDWLDKEFLQTSLREGLKNDQLTLHSYELSPAAAVGEHYGSQMFRARVVLQKNENSQKEDFCFIVKSMPLGPLREQVHNYGIFTKEMGMFVRTLPAVHEVLIKAYPEHEKIHAECYFAQGPPNDVLILEDLRQSGFVIGNRFDGLDLNHTVLVLKNYAKLHASSLIVIENNPQEVLFYNDSFWTPKYEDIIGKMFENGIKSVAEVVKNLKDLPGHDRFHIKLKNLENTILKKFYEAAERDDQALNVILHGDCWVGNMMFRYEESQVKASKLVDYQNSNYNSPALEIIHFIFNSSQHRFSRLDFLLETYYQTFTDTLDRLNYKLKKPFTLKILKEDIAKRLFLGLAFVLCFVPITSCPPSSIQDVNDVFEASGEDVKLPLHGHRGFLPVLRQALPFFEEQGVL